MEDDFKPYNPQTYWISRRGSVGFLCGVVRTSMSPDATVAALPPLDGSMSKAAFVRMRATRIIGAPESALG